MNWEHEYAENGVVSRDDALKAMEEYAQQKDTRKWISVKERLPERGCEVLVCLDGRVRQCFWFEGWFYQHVDKRLNNVTHWQHLPEPPFRVANQ